MCGIVGLAHLEGAPIRPDRLARMARAVAHRGPDAEGAQIFARHPRSGLSVGLGHRRLSILDPSPAGHQPMARAEGQLSIVFNGEIFNFKSLRLELEAQGCVFRTGTDTEVLLALYERDGDACLQRLNGMFAFALHDARRGRLLVARDRFGVKPLYYRAQGRELLFASELGGVLAALDELPPLNPEGLDLLLGLCYIPSPWTIFEGIQKLPPGFLLVADERGIEVRPWYHLPAGPPDVDEPTAREELSRLLDDAVRLRLVSDRPLGCFLSGGLDSSLVTALAVRHAPHPVETFSITFPGERMYDESRYSRAVAAHLGTIHHELPVTPAEVQGAIPSVLDSLDEPFADASAIPTWLLARFTRASIVVALSGDGADEVFGGYRKYQGELFYQYWFRLPRALREGVLKPLSLAMPASRGSFWLELPRRVQRFVRGADPDTARRLYGWMRLYDAQEAASLGREGVGLGRAEALLRPGFEALVSGIPDPVNKALRVDVGYCLPDQMMVKADRMSMRHGLEVRTPFLDYRLVELAFRMPGRLKLRPGQGKWLVLDTFKPLLPKLLHRRPKRGFELPLANWLRGPLRPLVEDTLSSSSTLAQPWLEPSTLRRIYADHSALRREYTPQLWTALVFLWWHRRMAGGAWRQEG